MGRHVGVDVEVITCLEALVPGLIVVIGRTLIVPLLEGVVEGAVVGRVVGVPVVGGGVPLALHVALLLSGQRLLHGGAGWFGARQVVVPGSRVVRLDVGVPVEREPLLAILSVEQRPDLDASPDQQLQPDKAHDESISGSGEARVAISSAETGVSEYGILVFGWVAVNGREGPNQEGCCALF